MTVKVSKQWSCLSSVLVPSVGDSHMRGMHISCFFRAKKCRYFPSLRGFHYSSGGKRWLEERNLSMKSLFLVEVCHSKLAVWYHKIGQTADRKLR